MTAKRKPVNRRPKLTGMVIATKSARAAGKVKRQRIDETGLTSRIRGHVSARGKRAQAKRDRR